VKEKKSMTPYYWLVLPVTYLFCSGVGSNQDTLMNVLMFSTVLTLASGCLIYLNQQLSPHLRITPSKCIPVCRKCVKGLREVSRLVVPQDPEEECTEKKGSRVLKGTYCSRAK